MNKKKFLQTESGWGGLGYPKKPWYIRNCGCGEVSIANCIIEMDKYADYTPATIQPYCKQFAAPNGDGTYFSGIPKMMKHYGMTEVKEHATMDPLWDELAKGDRVAIYLMGKRPGGSKRVHWTSGGHFVCSVDYKYENGKHKVYVKDSYSNSSLRNGWISYEENMKGDVLKVWSGKIVTVEPTSYRPTSPYTGTLPGSKVVDGSKGADVTACQTFLNWCINAGLSVDGKAGKHTVKAIKVFQKTYDIKVDGVFGSQSLRKAKEIIAEHAKVPSTYSGEYPNTTASRGDEIVAKAKEYAWPAGTAKSKYAYSSGSAKSLYKAALKKFMNKSAKVSQTDCGYFVSTCVRAIGIDSFLALPGKPSQKYPSLPDSMEIVHEGEITDGVLQAGDVIRYRKTSGQHTVIYLGSGQIAQANRNNAFPHMGSGKPYSKDNVKKSTIQVIRAYRSYLKKGDKGEDVKKLQRYINWFFGKDVLTVDGDFGANTDKYAKLMQSNLGFKDADGLVGQKTIEAMKAYKK